MRHCHQLHVDGRIIHDRVYEQYSYSFEVLCSANQLTTMSISEKQMVIRIVKKLHYVYKRK